LAPFRGFIQERSVAKKEGKMIGDTVLYFGCRHKSQDYIYEEELAGYEEEGTVSDLQVAFSRDQAHKVYVTHKMEENKEQIWKIINDGGYLYVCGDARNMARDVHSILFKILKEQGGLSEEEATSYIKKMQTRSRYQQDVWS
jgi:NADPH-ferrihemoprotein reductase